MDAAQSLSFQYAFLPDADQWDLDLLVRETGEPLTDLRCQLTAVTNGEYGRFASSGTPNIDFALTSPEPGLWRPSQSVGWLPAAELPLDAQTRFRFRFYSGGADYGEDSRWWTWQTSGQALDFRGAWPAAWSVAQADDDSATTWHRWNRAPWVTADQSPLLACTGASYKTSALWPEVTYQNRAHTTLTSAPLGSPVTGVRLTHAIEVEMLKPVPNEVNLRGYRLANADF